MNCLSGITRLGLLLDFGWTLTSHPLMHNEGVFKVRKTSWCLEERKQKPPSVMLSVLQCLCMKEQLD